MPLRSAWSLHNVDYFTVDPRPLRLALAMPEGAKLKEVSMTLRLLSDEQENPGDIILFDILMSGPEFRHITFPDDATSKIILRIPPSRVDDLIRIRQSMKKARDNEQRGSLSIGMRPDPDWLKAYCAKNDGDFKIKAWIKINDLDGYFPLIRESKVMTLLKQSGNSFCDEIKNYIDQAEEGINDKGERGL